MRSLVIFVFLYACETWTRVREKNAGLRLLNVLYNDHVSNEDVRRKVKTVIGEYDDLLTLVRNGRKGGLATSQGLLVKQK